MDYVDEGMKVFAKCGGRWVPVVVACAMGDTARVVNGVLGIDTWYPVRELKSNPPEL